MVTVHNNQYIGRYCGLWESISTLYYNNTWIIEKENETKSRGTQEAHHRRCGKKTSLNVITRNKGTTRYEERGEIYFQKNEIKKKLYF